MADTPVERREASNGGGVRRQVQVMQQRPTNGFFFGLFR